MVLEFEVVCELDFDRESYWKVKATKAFFDFLVEDKALYKMDAEAEWDDPDGSVHLKCAYIPRTVEIPDIVRALLGETILEVLDEQSWNRDVDKYRLDYKVTPTFLTESIKTTGTLSLLEHPENPEKCVHVVKGKTEVNLPFVSGFIEDTLRVNMNKFYEAYPAHVTRFRQHLVDLVGEQATTEELVEAYLNISNIHPELIKKKEEEGEQGSSVNALQAEEADQSSKETDATGSENNAAADGVREVPEQEEEDTPVNPGDALAAEVEAVNVLDEKCN
ncbi:hypothetical protein NDN08_002985 [Rhodosorus marinus]|uniref:PRELI/MSF1 domain-containing protein n=1 Tax=Rhodosorus marinus TaxID=101924 RepID=A0AAV8UZQ6_9RHOD|nr:hypothetical protein NDN08_002985 [Rhodosorus marinus]